MKRFLVIFFFWVLWVGSAWSIDYHNKFYEIHFKYGPEWEEVEVKQKYLLASFLHQDRTASLNVYAYTYAKPVTINGFQERRKAIGYDGWMNLGERLGTEYEANRANVDDSYLAIFSRQRLNEGAYDRWLVTEYYFTKGNRGYVISLSTTNSQFKAVARLLKEVVESFWVGDGQQPQAVKVHSRASDWVMAGKNAQNQRSVQGNFDYHTPQLYWRSQYPFGTSMIDKDVYPLFVKGEIYVSLGNELYSFSAYDGTQNWVYSAPRPIIHSPAYYHGVVYFVTDTEPRTLRGVFTETGRLIMSIDLEGERCSDPIIHGANLFIMDGDMLKSFSLNTGRLNWQIESDWKDGFKPLVSGQYLVIIEQDNRLRLLDIETGNEFWTQILASNAFFTPLVYQDTMVITALKRKGLGSVLSMRALHLSTGKQYWENELDNRFEVFLSPPSVYNGIVYLLLKDHYSSVLQAIDLNTGALIWAREMDQYVPYPALNPVVTGDVIYAVLDGHSDDGVGLVLYPFNAQSGEAFPPRPLVPFLSKQRGQLKYYGVYRDALYMLFQNNGIQFEVIK